MTRIPFEISRLDMTDSMELNDAAAVATRAFQFDPFFVHLTKRPLLRARGLGIFIRSTLASLGERAEVDGARQPDGRLIGVAAWLKPGGYPLPISAQLHQSAGAFWAMWPVPRSLVEGTKYLLAIDKVHPREPLWYLNLLVADPSAQRSGVGTKLQETVLERADAEGLPAYLETQNPDNVPYYGRFGYEVVHEARPVPNGPPLWTLRREPRG